MKNIEGSVRGRIFPAQRYQHHQLSTTARRYVKLLRHPSVRVFDDVILERIRIEDGVIVVMCADGDRSLGALLAVAGLFGTKHRWTTRIASWFRRTSVLFLWAFLYIYPRMHIFAWHGGAHRLVKGSRTNKPGRGTDSDLLDEIMTAVELKGIYQIVLVDHMPCGKLDHHGFSPEEQVRDMMTARQRILDTYKTFRARRAMELAQASDGEAAAAMAASEIDVVWCTQVDYGDAGLRRKLRLYHTSSRQVQELQAVTTDPRINMQMARAVQQHLEVA